MVVCARCRPLAEGTMASYVSSYEPDASTGTRQHGTFCGLATLTRTVRALWLTGRVAGWRTQCLQSAHAG